MPHAPCCRCEPLLTGLQQVCSWCNIAQHHHPACKWLLIGGDGGVDNDADGRWQHRRDKWAGTTNDNAECRCGWMWTQTNMNTDEHEHRWMWVGHMQMRMNANGMTSTAPPLLQMWAGGAVLQGMMMNAEDDNGTMTTMTMTNMGDDDDKCGGQQWWTQGLLLLPMWEWGCFFFSFFLSFSFFSLSLNNPPLLRAPAHRVQCN